MNDSEYAKLCKSHGLTVEQASENLRCSKLVDKKYALIVELREKYKMKFTEICRLMDYADRSGARRAYGYAKKLQKEKL